MSGNKQGRAHTGAPWRTGVWGGRMIETLEHPHLAPHALLIPLDFLL